ncbi:enoyl-CoA hydratase/isomerase family protein [Mesorhizobium sp. A623]
MRDYETLIVDRHDDVVVIRMNRPRSLNACNVALWQDLRRVAEDIGQEAGIRAAIITGEGRAFCVGADLKETAWNSETPDQSRLRIEGNQQELARLLVGLPVPLIAAINGYALGGGLEITLACDIRIAAEGAKVGFPESGVGSFITGGASLLLPRLVGPSRAKRMLFTAEHITAAQALDIGLVDEVVPPEKLLARALEIAASIARNAPLSVRKMKDAINRFTSDELEAALGLETETLLALYDTADHKEGDLSFAERRAPRFTGR